MRPLSGERTERSIARRRLFLDPDPSLRARRATDGLLLVWAALGLAGLGVLEDAQSATESALARLVAAFPGWFDSAWLLLSDLPLLWSVVLVAVALAQRRRRLAGSAGLAVVFAIGLTLLSVRVLTGGWPSFNELLATDGNQPAFPAVRLGLAAAVTIAVAANTAVPVRRFGTWMLALGTVGTLAAGLASPFGTPAALLVGLAAAACARLVLGTSAGQPSVDEISDGLAALGLPVLDLHPSPASGPASSHWSGPTTAGAGSSCVSTAGMPMTISCWPDCGVRRSTAMPARPSERAVRGLPSVRRS